VRRDPDAAVPPYDFRRVLCARGERPRCRRAADQREELASPWRQSVGINVGMTDEELAGFYSPRQVEFFNAKLREQGETWMYG